MSNIDIEIDSLLTEYIDSAIDKTEEIEGILLKGESSELSIRSLLLIVHSLKGSLGSYGLDFGSTICHQFEDIILNEKSDSYNFEILLKHKDILADYLKAFKKDRDTSTTDFQVKLKQLSPTKDKNLPRALLVESTKLFRKKIKEIAIQEEIELITTSNGLEAFNRLITDDFNLLITSNQVGALNGVELIRSIRAIDRIDQKVLTVLLTSDDQVRQTEDAADFVIDKDVSFQNEIQSIFQHLSSNELYSIREGKKS